MRLSEYLPLSVTSGEEFFKWQLVIRLFFNCSSVMFLNLWVILRLTVAPCL